MILAAFPSWFWVFQQYLHSQVSSLTIILYLHLVQEVFFVSLLAVPGNSVKLLIGAANQITDYLLAESTSIA
jgi:hypothetical protein